MKATLRQINNALQFLGLILVVHCPDTPMDPDPITLEIITWKAWKARNKINWGACNDPEGV